MIIFQDQQNNYWFGTMDQGVFKYDGKKLIQFTVDDGLCSNRIRDIQEDHLGNMFFDTGEGISKFDGKSFETLGLADGHDPDHEWKLEADDLWFAGKWNENGPYRYDGQFLYHLEFPLHPLEKGPLLGNQKQNYSPYDVYSVFRDSKGYVWFGTAAFGVCRYDGKTHQWIFDEGLTEFEGGPALGVRSILEDKEGNFWFNNDLLHRYELLPSQALAYSSEFKYEIKEGLSSLEAMKLKYKCMSLTQDDEGNIWMLTYDQGVWKYDGEKLSHYPIKIGGRPTLLFSMYKDKKGVLWLGSHNAGVLRYDGNGFEN